MRMRRDGQAHIILIPKVLHTILNTKNDDMGNLPQDSLESLDLTGPFMMESSLVSRAPVVSVITQMMKNSEMRVLTELRIILFLVEVIHSDRILCHLALRGMQQAHLVV